MTNDPTYDRLRELSWRRKLAAGEAAELRAWLAAHPETLTDWEAEAGLNEALGELPDAPVPSNFTARVLQSIERESGAAARRQRRNWQLWTDWRWLPKVAVTVVVLGAGLFSYQQVARAARRAEYAKSVTAVSDVASLPGPDVLKDFDAIRVSNPTPVADEELLAALK
jgi:anti-sigma factor RsiW